MPYQFLLVFADYCLKQEDTRHNAHETHVKKREGSGREVPDSGYFLLISVAFPYPTHLHIMNIMILFLHFAVRQVVLLSRFICIQDPNPFREKLFCLCLHILSLREKHFEKQQKKKSVAEIITSTF